MSLQILLAILVSANTSEDESPVPAEEKPPSLTRCHPLADPRAEAIRRQAAGSNYLAELPEHFRGALLPGAAAQGYCNVGGQEIGTEAAAPQVVLPRRLRADHSSGTEPGGASQSPVWQYQGQEGQRGQEGQATAGSTVQQTFRALQQAQLSLYAPLLKRLKSKFA